jgi:hypothetical protein
MEVALKEGKYIYCVIESNQSQSFGPLGIGGRGDELYSICFNDIAAVVSNSLITKYPVSRENTLAHEKAIEEVMKTYTVLPVRFATIAEDEETVKMILEKEYKKFKELLDGIKSKKELGLKAVFKEDVIYKEILEKYAEIKRLKAMLASKPPTETYFQRMEIGKMVEEALEREKEDHKKVILDTLGPIAEDVKINDTYGERMIINAAFLVIEDKESEFDQKVKELDAKYGDKIKFKYVGLVPPFNFVNLVIETGKY